MNDWNTAAEIHERLKKFNKEDRDALLKKLPGAARRMGLVRCIEWLSTGSKNAELGQRVFAELAPTLGLATTIPAAVRELETGDRPTFLRAHRRALRLFDTLATLQRIED